MPKASNGRGSRNGRAVVPVPAYLALDAENKELRKQLACVEAENQVWRELIAEFRDMVTAHAMQHLPHSKQFKRIRMCMADSEFLEAEVRRLIEGNAKTAAAASTGA